MQASSVVLGSGLWVFRFKVNFTTLPNIDTGIGLISGNNVGAFFKQSDSNIYAGTSTANLGATGVSVTTGVTYYIDVRVNTTANPWLIDVSVNGSACGQRSTASAADTGAQSVVLGFTGAVTASAKFDDVILSTTSGDYPIGDGKVLGFVPNADGTHTATTTTIVKGTAASPTGGGNVAGATDVFNWVNARPIGGGATDATRLVNQQTVGTTLYAEVDFEPTTEVNAPRAVEVLTADQQASTAVGGFSTKLNDNGTEDVIITRSAAGVVTDRFVTKQYATMVGGGAWTLIRFNALKARFGYSGDATPDQYWRGIMIEAEFAVVAAAFIPKLPIVITQAINRSSTY